MTEREKRRFVKELMREVQRTIISNIPKMPEEWDGIELRQYLADKFADANYVRMHRTRKHNYNNEVVIRNL